MSVASSLTEKAFAASRERDWQELEELLTKAQVGLKKLPVDALLQLSPLYRSV